MFCIKSLTYVNGEKLSHQNVLLSIKSAPVILGFTVRSATSPVRIRLGTLIACCSPHLSLHLLSSVNYYIKAYNTKENS